MLALIDADILVHRVGFTTELDEEWIARSRFDEMMDGIITATGATEYQLWLSDKTSNNFRTKVYPEYKANRKSPKPKHYDAIKVHALKNWQAQIACNEEADDRLGITQCEFIPDSIICSIDKDLYQIPGQHFNFVSNAYRSVTFNEARFHFYYQLLKGDASDNLQGCPGIGEAKALQALPKVASDEEYFKIVKNLYIQQYAKKVFRTDRLDDEEDALK